MTLKIFAAHLASVCQLGTFVGTLVYHQIIRFGEASLAKFAHKFTLWSHLTAEIVATIVIINSHYRKHFGRRCGKSFSVFFWLWSSLALLHTLSRVIFGRFFYVRDGSIAINRHNSLKLFFEQIFKALCRYICFFDCRRELFCE